jgi:ABC-2 type transport system ATP-binding protein
MTGDTIGTPLLDARGLTRHYRHVTALNNVDLSIGPGDAVALVGPNGAGKSTLLNLLAGVERPSAGAVRWGSPGVPARVGWVPHDPALYSRLTVRQNLRFFARLEREADSRREVERLLDHADLREFADRPAAGLSTGTRQRLNLAIALVGRPSALLLDEPSATLSPDQRLRLWQWLSELRAEDGLALVFCTQSVAEADRYADRMVVLVRGQRAFDGTLAELLQAYPQDPGSRDAAEQAFIELIESASSAA